MNKKIVPSLPCFQLEAVEAETLSEAEGEVERGGLDWVWLTANC